MRRPFDFRFLFFLSFAIISLTSSPIIYCLEGRLPPASVASSLLLVVLRKLFVLVEPPKTALYANSKSTLLLLSEISTDLVRAEDESSTGFDDEDFISPAQSSEASSP